MDDSNNCPNEPRILLRTGGPVDSCSAVLRVWGEALDPDTVSAALGAAPTTACRQGDVTRGKIASRVEPHGKWHLSIDHRTGTTLEAVIVELMNRLTDDLTVWADLTSRFQADLYCGVQLESWNRGLCLSPKTLKGIAERGLELGLDIYYVGASE